MHKPFSILAFVSLLMAAPIASAGDAEWGPLTILDQEVAPGASLRTTLGSEASFTRDVVDTHVEVVRGSRPGPTLCLTGAVHGDELNGVEIARRSVEETRADSLAGTLIAIPIVNSWGFRSGNRYAADRRDLNRAFPGSNQGSLASRVAFVVFDRVIRHCDVLLDLHTGSARRTNLPQARVDGSNPRAVELAQTFEIGIVLLGKGPVGSLRQAAGAAGIATLLYEAGGPNRFQAEEIERGVEGVFNVMESMQMVAHPPPRSDPQRYFASSTWVRANAGGIFLTEKHLGSEIEPGDLLGAVTDPVTSDRSEIRAPFGGTLIGMAYPQVVLPGFGLFHIGRSEGDPSDFSETE
jgi:predicted deacylase